MLFSHSLPAVDSRPGPVEYIVPETKIDAMPAETCSDCHEIELCGFGSVRVNVAGPFGLL